MWKPFCLAVLVATLGTTVAPAQVTLERKYMEGSKSVVHSDTKTTQTLTLAGMDLETKSSTFMVVNSTIGQRGADGTLKVEEKTNTLQSELTLPGGIMLQFDSANPDKKADNPMLEPILDIYRAMLRLPMTVELDAKNKIAEIKLPDGEYEKLPEAAKERFNPETRKKAAEQMHMYLPDGPVKMGDNWERSHEANLGGGQIMSFRTKYEYAGTVEQDGRTLDKITGKSFEVGFSITGNAMLQVTKSDLKIAESATTILFDRELGAVASRTSKVQIVGPLTLVINGMELPGKVDLTIEEKNTRQK